MKTLRTITTALAMAAAIAATPVLFAQTAAPKPGPTAPSATWQNVWLRDLPEPWAGGYFDNPRAEIFVHLHQGRLYLIGSRKRDEKHPQYAQSNLDFWMMDFATGETVRGPRAMVMALAKGMASLHEEFPYSQGRFYGAYYKVEVDPAVPELERISNFMQGSFDQTTIPDWEIYSDNLPYDEGMNEETYNPFAQKIGAIYKPKTPDERRFDAMIFVHDPKGRPLRFKFHHSPNWKRSHLRSLSLYFFWLPDNSLLALSQYEGLALRLTFDKERGFASPAIDNKRLFLVPYEDYEKAIIGHPKYFKEDNVWLEKTILDWLKSRR